MVSKYNTMSGASYKWDVKSAMRRLQSNVQMCATIPGVSVCKTTDPHNPETDAYRNCGICRKHVNYHNGGKCPK